MPTHEPAQSEVILRPYQPGDEAEVIAVWHRSGIAAYPFLPTWPSFTLEMAGDMFRKVIQPACLIWVGVANGRITAFLAMKGSYIDRLYVDTPEWRKGWGQRLLGLAKQLSSAGLELHTHQENRPACDFYETAGFEAVKFGISPPPESAPDIEYHWRP